MIFFKKKKSHKFIVLFGDNIFQDSDITFLVYII